MRWCTVTVTDAEGRRHSVDVQASSTFDAAHLCVVEAKSARQVGMPKPTLATVFEVVASGKVYRVNRSRVAALDCGEPDLAEWIEGDAIPAETGAGVALSAPLTFRGRWRQSSRWRLYIQWVAGIDRRS